MVHAALLLLMLEAVTRTSFHHQPEAQHPKSSAIHKLGRPITPSFGAKANVRWSPRNFAFLFLDRPGDTASLRTTEAKV
jgi:hypothetical protein